MAEAARRLEEIAATGDAALAGQRLASLLSEAEQLAAALRDLQAAQL